MSDQKKDRKLMMERLRYLSNISIDVQKLYQKL